MIFARDLSRPIRKSSLQVVNADCVFPEESSLIRFSGGIGESEQCSNPFFVTGSEIAHRPIAAKHHPLPPERFDNVIDKGTQIFCFPIRRITVCDEAGNLAGKRWEISRARGCGRARDVAPDLSHPGHRSGRE
jgi:hypothetical protein